MRISDWSSDVCSSDLEFVERERRAGKTRVHGEHSRPRRGLEHAIAGPDRGSESGDEGERQRGRELLEGLPLLGAPRLGRDTRDRKSGVSGKSVAVRVDLGGRRIIKKKKKKRTS